MQRLVTYDTSIFVSYRPEEFPSGFLMSAVVLQEQAAAANDVTELKYYTAACGAYREDKEL